MQFRGNRFLSNLKVNFKMPSIEPNRELTLVCNELDSQGNIKTVSGKFLKGEVCFMHSLQPRDLRKLDGTLKNQLPAILVRESAILINLDFIKAVVKPDSVVLFESMNLSERVRQNRFIFELQQKIKTTKDQPFNLPFEFQITELILQKVCNNLQQEFDDLLPQMEKTLADFVKRVHWDKLKKLLECKRKINHFKSKVQNIRNTIAEVLDSDDDMSAMYLSSKRKQGRRPTSAHEEIELLLETYLKMADEVVSRVEELSSNMESTEDIVNIGLVGQRNELLLLELKLTIGTFSASLGGFGASLFGMNLVSSLESSKFAFFIASGMFAGISSTAFMIAWRKMRQLVSKN